MRTTLLLCTGCPDGTLIFSVFAGLHQCVLEAICDMLAWANGAPTGAPAAPSPARGPGSPVNPAINILGPLVALTSRGRR